VGGGNYSVQEVKEGMTEGEKKKQVEKKNSGELQKGEYWDRLKSKGYVYAGRSEVGKLGN